MQHNRDLYYLEQMVYHAEEALEFFSQIDNSEERLIKYRSMNNFCY